MEKSIEAQEGKEEKELTLDEKEFATYADALLEVPLLRAQIVTTVNRIMKSTASKHKYKVQGEVRRMLKNLVKQL